jgi:hypothetical protein
VHSAPAGSKPQSSSFEQQTWAPAGNSDGARFTPFKGTCADLLRAVHEKPGLTLKELIDGGLKHHYYRDSTARSCIAHWVQQGAIPGVRAERDGRLLRLYPAPKQAAVEQHGFAVTEG